MNARPIFIVALLFTLLAACSGCASAPCYSGHVETQQRLVMLRGMGWVTEMQDVFVCDIPG